MKNFIIPTALAAVVAGSVSCGKMQEKMSDTPFQETTMLSVSLEGIAPSGWTKVAGDAEMDEKHVKNVQIIVFNKESGQIDAVYYEDGLNVNDGAVSVPPLKCTAGDRVIYAILNAPVNYTADISVNTLSALKKVTLKLGDMGRNALVMTGSTEKTLSPGSDNIAVNVSRLVSAIVLNKVENKLKAPAYRDKFSIKGAYLLNVPGIQNLEGSLAASGSSSQASSWYAWYSKQSTGSTAELLSEGFPSPVSIPYNSAHTVKHSFYAFPNDVVVEKSDGTNKSNTILVVECAIDGNDCVYPVYLPATLPNHKYYVNLAVEHVGADPVAPWKKIEFSQMGASVVVSEWEDVSVNDTI